MPRAWADLGAGTEAELDSEKEKGMYQPRIYQIDDSAKMFGKATIYVQWNEEHISRQVVHVHEDTDVTALANHLLHSGVFSSRDTPEGMALDPRSGGLERYPLQ